MRAKNNSKGPFTGKGKNGGVLFFRSTESKHFRNSNEAYKYG